MMKKRFCSLALALALALSLLPGAALAASSRPETKYFPSGKIEMPRVPRSFPEQNAAGPTFSGWSGASALMASDWAEAELAEAERLGLIPESLEGQDLTKPVTRKEFAAVSVRVYECLTGAPADEWTGESPFADTADAEILRAFALGVTNGADRDRQGGALFVPDMQLNRETLATMLTRVYKKYAFDGWTLEKDADYAAQFREEFTMPEPFADDRDISDWARDSVYFMSANGIVGGVGDGKFAPRAVTTAEQEAGYAAATREAALVMAYRMVKNLG